MGSLICSGTAAAWPAQLIPRPNQPSPALSSHGHRELRQRGHGKQLGNTKMSLNTAAALLGVFQPQPKSLFAALPSVAPEVSAAGQQTERLAAAGGILGAAPRGNGRHEAHQPPTTRARCQLSPRLRCPRGSIADKGRPGAAAEVPGRQKNKSDFPTRRPCPAQDKMGMGPHACRTLEAGGGLFSC